MSTASPGLKDGPVAGIAVFDDEAEVIERANATQYGLGREGSKHGLDEYTDIKYLCLDVQASYPLRQCHS